ncbi:MAG: molybdopterin-dependent oxidoreductase [Dehalococcoidia bacterium]|nr:molybdopterin-dependent oxidoreductase [Dehalococcoidia bacterium]
MPELPVDRVSIQELSKAAFKAGRLGNATPLIPWLYAHDKKWAEMASKQEYNDQSLPRPAREYIDEALAAGWQPISPRPPKRPRFLYYSGPNPLRRWPNPRIIRDSLWASIDTIVTLDFRMSTSGLWSDYILPGCGYYEKPGVKYTSTYVPYVVVGDRAVPPLYESKHEWDVALLLAEKIQERAKARGIEPYTDSRGMQHNLATLYDDMSADGAYTPDAAGEERALDFILQYSAHHPEQRPWRRRLGEGCRKGHGQDQGRPAFRAGRRASTLSSATTPRTGRCTRTAGSSSGRTPGQPSRDASSSTSTTSGSSKRAKNCSSTRNLSPRAGSTRSG